MVTREMALQWLRKPCPEPSLVQHALASEAIMRKLAAHFGEDEELWGLTGLLHDIDYPQTHMDPSRHGIDGVALLEEEGKLAGDPLPEEALYAIKAHNSEMTGAEPHSRFDYALRCGESVTGLVITAALVRPTGMEGMQPSSLKKKMKDKAFAASVNRDRIRECEKADLDLDTFLALAIAAIASAENELGLKRKG